MRTPTASRSTGASIMALSLSVAVGSPRSSARFRSFSRRPLVLGLVFALIASPVFAVVRPDDPLADVPVPGPRASASGSGDYAEPRPVALPRVPSVRPRPAQSPRPPTHVALPVIVDRSSQSSGHRESGVASWFCGHGSPCTHGYPEGLYAAAGPLLRTGDWRGRYVLVEAGGRVLRVQLIDWCACPSRLLDLYSDAFSRLAPLSRGLVKVTVTY